MQNIIGNRNTLRILIHCIYTKLLIISELSNSVKKFFILSPEFLVFSGKFPQNYVTSLRDPLFCIISLQILLIFNKHLTFNKHKTNC